jgi:uncharacterized membrane protein
MSDIGPVEYMAVAFPGNKFTGKVAPALAELVDNKTIRIIDLAFVGKSQDGDLVMMEVEELESEIGAAFREIEDHVGELISEEDLRKIGAELEPNSSALMMVWEDLWASKLANAMRDADGVLMTIERVPYDVVQAAIDWSKANG